MLANLKSGSALLAMVCIVGGAMTNSAPAISVDVAKRCSALLAKAYPPRVVGNPAAGRVDVTAQSVQDYFKKCVANGGKMDDPAANEHSN